MNFVKNKGRTNSQPRKAPGISSHDESRAGGERRERRIDQKRWRT